MMQVAAEYSETIIPINPALEVWYDSAGAMSETGLLTWKIIQTSIKKMARSSKSYSNDRIIREKNNLYNTYLTGHCWRETHLGKWTNDKKYSCWIKALEFTS